MDIIWHGGMKTALPGVDQYPEYRRQKYGSMLQHHAPNLDDFLTVKEAHAMKGVRADMGIGAREPSRRVGRPVTRSPKVKRPKVPKPVVTVCTVPECGRKLLPHEIGKRVIRCGRCRQTRSGSQKGQ